MTGRLESNDVWEKDIIMSPARNCKTPSAEMIGMMGIGGASRFSNEFRENRMDRERSTDETTSTSLRRCPSYLDMLLV